MVQRDFFREYRTHSRDHWTQQGCLNCVLPQRKDTGKENLWNDTGLNAAVEYGTFPRFTACMFPPGMLNTGRRWFSHHLQTRSAFPCAVTGFHCTSPAPVDGVA